MTMLRTFINLTLSEAKTYWGKKASGIMYICLETNEVLLLKRSDEVEQPGTWGIAGGAFDDKGGEGFHSNAKASSDPSDTVWLNSAQRETIEEMGSLLETVKLISKTTFRDKAFAYRTYVYEVSKETRDNYTPQLNWENDEYEWFPLNDLPVPMHFGTQFTLDQLSL